MTYGKITKEEPIYAENCLPFFQSLVKALMSSEGKVGKGHILLLWALVSGGVITEDGVEYG